MRPLFCLLIFLICSSAAFATHIAGGYIRVAPVAGQPLKYRITVTVYYDLLTGSAAAQAATELTVCFGENGSRQQVKRTVNPLMPAGQGLSLGEYTTTYTYSGPGVYSVQATATNRNDNIRNIQGGASAAQPFSLKTIVQVGTNSQNQTPTLSVPTTGLLVSLNQRMSLPILATDADGDSLSFSLAFPLTNPLTELTSMDLCTRFAQVTSYQFPNDVKQAGTFRLDAKTGLITWDVPTEQGQYAVALIVSERRNGMVISQTQQELLLTVVDRGGTPVTPPAYAPAQIALITAVPDAAVPSDMVLMVSPNPATGGTVRAELTLTRAQASNIKLLDSQGRIYETIHFDQPARSYQYMFDLMDKPAGLYFIRAEAGGKQVVQKVLKQ